MVGDYVPQAGHGLCPSLACPVCVVLDHYAVVMAAVWDGTAWVNGAGLGQAFIAAFRLALGTEPHAADLATWRQIVQDHPPREGEGSVSIMTVQSWAFTVRNPGVEPHDAWELLDRANRILEVHHGYSSSRNPQLMSAPEVTAIVDGSRFRWNGYQSAAWTELDDRARDAVAHLARTDLRRGDLEGLPHDVVRTLHQTIIRVWNDKLAQDRPTPGDDAAWTEGGWGDWTATRFAALATWARENGNGEVSTPSPLLDAEERPRFGPRTPQSQALLDRWQQRSTLEDQCLGLAVPIPLPLHDPDQERAWHAAYAAIGAHLLSFANRAAHYAFAASAHEHLPVAVSHRVTAELTFGLVDDKRIALLVEPWDRAFAAAETITSSGPVAVDRAAQFELRWPQVPPDALSRLVAFAITADPDKG
jgi:hypothetical protein